MNATKQQRILEGIMNASSQLAAASQALAGGNGGAPTIPGLYLDFLPPNLRGNPRDYFVYGVDFLNIAAGATQTQTFVVQNDSDFLIVDLAGVEVDPVAEETPLPPSALTIQITDSGSGRNLQNRALGYPTVVGTGQLPAYMPYPKFIDRASEVSVTVVNNHGAGQAYRIRLSFIGFKIFDMMRGGR